MPKGISRLAVKSRRQEIERHLAAYGLTSGPRRLFRGGNTGVFEQAPSRRLRLALEGLGPIFSSFGLYMSARVDLWSVRDCLELTAIPDKAAAIPKDLVSELLSEEIGYPTQQTFGSFDPKPFESRLLFQSHYARLTDGADVIVKIIRPEAESQLSSEIDLLLLLKDSFASCGLRDSIFKAAVGDFCHTIQQQIDFVHEARALEALAQDAEDYDALRALQVHKPLSTSRVLVVEKVNGLRLDEILSVLPEPGGDADRLLFENLGFERNELARLLCEVWLRQALLGRSFSVEPRAENILILPGKQLAFTGGAFAALSSEPQANLWEYLLAAANENSDKACSCLVREMRREGEAKEDVRQRFRQAMPFRDGGWDAGGARETLAELLFVQWRFAIECGYTPSIQLPAFFRGLFSIADVARRLALRIDPLAEGVRDLRLLAGLAGFREMMNPSGLMDKYSGLMVDLPQYFDDALSLAAQGKLQPKPESTEAIHRRRLKNSSAVTIALLLVLTALALLSQHFATSGAVSQWSARISGAAFVLLGAQVLRNVVRNR
jgi:ubiquinone biosynthesis protein